MLEAQSGFEIIWTIDDDLLFTKDQERRKSCKDWYTLCIYILHLYFLFEYLSISLQKILNIALKGIKTCEHFFFWKRSNDSIVKLEPRSRNETRKSNDRAFVPLAGSRTCTLSLTCHRDPWARRSHRRDTRSRPRRSRRSRGRRSEPRRSSSMVDLAISIRILRSSERARERKIRVLSPSRAPGTGVSDTITESEKLRSVISASHARMFADNTPFGE